jgi:ATP-dependent exoDNAse (exonuclease V) beta subunit
MTMNDKNLLILASAGSGKTFQLANRIIELVARGVEPEKIVALTFTRKAAGEFADSVLTQLAKAADNPSVADKLRDDLQLRHADFAETLRSVVRALPQLTLGTMDGFFAKVVRGFQYELGLTGGKFDLLEGPRAEAASDEILATILGRTLEEEGADEFLQAFRRATIGKEDQGVMESLRAFVKSWHGRYRDAQDSEWGPSALAAATLNDWERHKDRLSATVLRGLDGVEYTRKDQRDVMEKVIATLVSHTIGSGSLGSASGLLAVVLGAANQPEGPLSLKHYKEFQLGGPSGDALRNLVLLAANCEMAAALLRTRAVREVVADYDAICERQLRQRGLLGFDDVKFLMGEWIKGEDARLRREAVDFRLDARHEHWLLDEFQDTSRADWLGLLPLIDEAAGDEEGTIFVVGDRKQAIYAWRGGEVGLFDEVIDRYHSAGLQIKPMVESWRSCPEVLSLVNQVCGDATTLRELFGEAATHWHWENHVSAAPLTSHDKRGEARVELVEGTWDDRMVRLGELLLELGVGQREMTCGVLVRSNAMVRKVADHLRSMDFDVIEEGRREPAKDNPVGVVLSHLLNWLANPADAFARHVVEMSPLSASLRARFGEHREQIWEGLLGAATCDGFAAMIEDVVEPHWADWSDFGRRRAGDIMTALATLDARGGATAPEAAEWIRRLEVSQSPGVAAVQVLTIHKSKGLGFDIVVLPEIPNESTPVTQHFDVAAEAGWISQTPPAWARNLLPAMRQAEANWGTRQCYEAFCTLYVALTRSKRGLYIFLEPSAKTPKADKPSLANWLARSVGSNDEPGVVYQSGSPDWVESLPPLTRAKDPVALPTLAIGIPPRERITPSGSKKKTAAVVTHSASGMKFGNEVHAAFENVGWVDEEAPALPASDAGNLVASLLETPKIRLLFERKSRAIELFREQPIEAIVGDKWLSGIMDRLHLHRDDAGVVRRVEVIDYKTDGLDEISELEQRYSGQMQAYREVMQRAYPTAEVECIIVSTRCRDWLAISA